ncbi:hypothetical protein LECLMA074M_10145 [Leclercia sp. M-A074-M]
MAGSNEAVQQQAILNRYLLYFPRSKNLCMSACWSMNWLCWTEDMVTKWS